MTMPPLPKPDLEDHEHEAWGQNVVADFVTVAKMRAYGEACAAAERERCADVCDKEAADANSSKRKPFLTASGKTLYEGMAGAAQNCAAAIRGQATD